MSETLSEIAPEKAPEYDTAKFETYVVNKPLRTINTRKGPKILGGQVFTFCAACDHLVGATKTSCKCDGVCHPVLEEYDSEEEARQEILSRRRAAARESATGKKKAPKQWNDLGRI